MIRNHVHDKHNFVKKKKKGNKIRNNVHVL